MSTATRHPGMAALHPLFHRDETTCFTSGARLESEPSISFTVLKCKTNLANFGPDGAFLCLALYEFKCQTCTLSVPLAFVPKSQQPQLYTLI